MYPVPCLKGDHVIIASVGAVFEKKY